MITRHPSTHAPRALAHARHTTSPPLHTLNTQPPPPRACTAQRSPIYAARSSLASRSNTPLLLRVLTVIRLLRVCRNELGDPALAAHTGVDACTVPINKHKSQKCTTHTHTHTQAHAAVTGFLRHRRALEHLAPLVVGAARLRILRRELLAAFAAA